MPLRLWSFIKRAGTVILAASIVIWVLNSLSFEGGFHFITDLNGGESILELIGKGIAYIFIPLGFGDWKYAVATILGLLAKEEIVGVFGTLSEMMPEGSVLFDGSKLEAFSFMIFNLLCAPCFAAMGAIRKEMNNAKWTVGAISYMCVFAYAISLMVYQFGMYLTGAKMTVWTVLAAIVLITMIYLLFRKNKYARGGVR